MRRIRRELCLLWIDEQCRTESPDINTNVWDKVHDKLSREVGSSIAVVSGRTGLPNNARIDVPYLEFVARNSEELKETYFAAL
jgi:hypothetical protein